jgi:prevent-host-death family protein
VLENTVLDGVLPLTFLGIEAEYDLFMTIPFNEAKDRLEEVLQAAANGEDVTITLENGQAVKITPAQTKPRRRMYGDLKGKIWMADDFNDTPEDFKEYLE